VGVRKTVRHVKTEHPGDNRERRNSREMPRQKKMACWGKLPKVGRPVLREQTLHLKKKTKKFPTERKAKKKNPPALPADPWHHQTPK